MINIKSSLENRIHTMRISNNKILHYLFDTNRLPKSFIHKVSF